MPLTPSKPPQAVHSTEIVSLEGGLGDDGRVTVRTFSWKGMQLPVTDVGRQWTEPTLKGVRRCLLVMAAGYGTFELCLDPHDMLWHARCISPIDPMV